MHQSNNANWSASWQDATNQLKFAEHNIIQVQQKMQTGNNDPQEQFWLQEALGAVTHAKDIIDSRRRQLEVSLPNPNDGFAGPRHA